MQPDRRSSEKANPLKKTLWISPHTPSAFSGINLPALLADENQRLLQRLRDFAERHGLRAAQPQLASERSLFDPRSMVASYLQDRGMTVTRNAQLNTMQSDLLAKNTAQGHTITLGVAVTFERIIALAPDTVAITV